MSVALAAASVATDCAAGGGSGNGGCGCGIGCCCVRRLLLPIRSSENCSPATARAGNHPRSLPRSVGSADAQQPVSRADGRGRGARPGVATQ